MLAQCVLFEKGGNYSTDEIEWYRGQMKEINEMITKVREERDNKMKDLNNEMERLMREPFELFEKDYKGSIHSLSAKEGLGKTFGQPRRLAQEKIRGEMTRCEQAQKGIETMIEKVQKLCEKNNEYGDGFDYSKEKVTLTMDIRITMQALIRGIIFYGMHLNGFLKEPKALPRLSY
jgi:golgin subfamily A member 4